MGGVNSAGCETPRLAEAQGMIDCLGVVHMEERVQVRVQVEMGREEQGEGETHREGQNKETTRNNQPLIMGGMRMG